MIMFMVKRFYLFACLVWIQLVSLAGVVTGSVKDAENGASFSDACLQSWFDKVTYVGAFPNNDNWLRGWTEFDPQNADY